MRPPLQAIAERYGARVKVAEVPPGPPVLSTLVAEVYGPDYDRQRELARKIREIFEQTDGRGGCRLVRGGGPDPLPDRGRPGKGRPARHQRGPHRQTLQTGPGRADGRACCTSRWKRKTCPSSLQPPLAAAGRTGRP